MTKLSSIVPYRLTLENIFSLLKPMQASKEEYNQPKAVTKLKVRYLIQIYMLDHIQIYML